MSTHNPDQTWTVPDQTQTHPRPPQPIYGIPKPICSIPKGMLHQHLLSKHSWSGEHHSQTHLTIPNEPKTSQIPLTNPELVCSPLNPKTQYVQPRSGKAWTLKHYSQLSLIPFLLYLLLSVPLYPCLILSYHSFPPSTLYPSSPYHTLLYLYTSVLTFMTTPRPLLQGPCLQYHLV